MTAGRPTYAVIGDPVEHSLSPRLFAILFAELGLECHYTALRVGPCDLPEAVARVRRGTLAGLSVTLPLKEAILGHLDQIHPLAARIGAVNTVVRSADGSLQGFNTDLFGFRAALEGAGRHLAAARVVLLGAGGAARAAAFAAIAAGSKSLVIANRSPERAIRLGLDLVATGLAWPEGELLRRWMEGEKGQRQADPAGVAAPSGPAGKCYVSVLPLEAAQLAQPVHHADVLVNATSVGLQAPDADPLPPPCRIHPQLAVLDMVYRPIETALLRRASAAGAARVDGLWMLVHQALEQLRLWTGRTPGPEIATLLHERLREELS